MRGFLGNPRRVLIVVHDLVVTALAILATLYVRFGDGQNGGFEERYPWLVIILPCYVAYAGLVYWYFHLYMAKWRFASLPDLRNIFRAVIVLAISLLVLDYVLLYHEPIRNVLFRQSNDRPLLVSANVLLRRSADRLSPVPVVANPAARQRTGRDADPYCRACRGCGGVAASDRERGGQERAAGRHFVALVSGSGSLGAGCAGPRLPQRSRAGDRCTSLAKRPRQPPGAHTECA